MINTTLLIPIIIILVCIVVAVICIISHAKGKEEEPSILDINVDGVPSSSEAQDFSYGYEKEETVVMQPVVENSEPVVEEPAQTPIEQPSQEIVEPQVEQSAVENAEQEVIENNEETKGDE